MLTIVFFFVSSEDTKEMHNENLQGKITHLNFFCSFAHVSENRNLSEFPGKIHFPKTGYQNYFEVLSCEIPNLSHISHIVC